MLATKYINHVVKGRTETEYLCDKHADDVREVGFTVWSYDAIGDKACQRCPSPSLPYTLLSTTQEAITRAATVLWNEVQGEHDATATLVDGATEMRLSWCNEHNVYHFLFLVAEEPCGLTDVDSAAALAVLISAVVNVDMMVVALAEELYKTLQSNVKSVLDTIKNN